MASGDLPRRASPSSTGETGFGQRCEFIFEPNHAQEWRRFLESRAH